MFQFYKMWFDFPVVMPFLCYGSVKPLSMVWIQDEENGGNVKRLLEKIFELSLKETIPGEPDVKPLVAACTGKYGDYQWWG